MLARTAASLFWLARYMERADYVARLLQVAGHMNAVRVDSDRNSEWESAIVASGCGKTYFAKYAEADEATVINFLALDRDNSSSVVNCIETARRNARAVRTALTADMWEAVNATWQELAGYCSAPMDRDRLAEFLDWVKARVGLFQGVCSNTMLRLDGFRFVRVGQFLERADNSARLLDVKYHVRLPTVSDVGGVIDYYQWLAILRVVGARRAYRVLFKSHVQPSQIAELARAAIGKGSELERLHRLCKAVRDHVDYLPHLTHAETTAGEAFAAGAGVCQDHAHVLISAARSVEFPARYVSGYLFSVDGAAAASHAWAEIFVSDLGWVGFDAANRQSPDERYVRIASGRDYRDAAPVRGVHQGGLAETLEVEVTIAERAPQTQSQSQTQVSRA